MSLFDSPVPLRCPGPTRRAALQVGGLGAIGLGLADLLGSSPPVGPASGKRGRAKSCIVLFLTGGPSQHDTWDPKPDAAAEVRGPFRPIPSAVPGLTVGELMPRTARVARHCCVLRAVSSGDSAHGSSVYYLLTGRPHQPMNTETVRPGFPNDRPHIGSALRSLRARKNGLGDLPAFVTLPERMAGNDFAVPPGQDAGFLGRGADPWLLTCDPAADSFEVPGLALPGDVSPHRLTNRRNLLARVDAAGKGLAHPGPSGTYDRHAARAYDLLRTSAARRAFELDHEPAAIRDRYGRHKFGQSVLLARRLIEAGVALVQVNWPREPNDRQTPNPCWDTHANHNARMKDVLMPPMDQTYAALLEDLNARGMLEETLVVWMGEFGRSPRLSSAGGREHWGGVFSVALAGGGVRGGKVIGASDRIGAHPREGRVTPPDLTATICHALGYEPSTEVHDMEGRPHPISRGEVIRGVF